MVSLWREDFFSRSVFACLPSTSKLHRQFFVLCKADIYFFGVVVNALQTEEVDYLIKGTTSKLFYAVLLLYVPVLRVHSSQRYKDQLWSRSDLACCREIDIY